MRLIFILLIFLIACNNSQPYDHYISINDFHWSTNKQEICKDVERLNLEFVISHPSLTEANASKYLFCIDLGDTIYMGKFKRIIDLRDISICNDDSRNIVWLRMALVDSFSNRVYIWQNKEAYKLNQNKRLIIKLRESMKKSEVRNAFEISFD
jgi:hypothetical protein